MFLNLTAPFSDASPDKDKDQKFFEGSWDTAW